MNALATLLPSIILLIQNVLAARGEYDSSRDGECGPSQSYTGTNPSMQQLVHLQGLLKQNTLDATEGILKRKKLMDAVKMMVAQVQTMATTVSKVEGIEKMEKELSESVKREYLRLTQIYRNSNALVLEIDGILAGNTDGAQEVGNYRTNGEDNDDNYLGRRADEASKLVECTRQTLKELETEYDALDSKFKELEKLVEKVDNLRSTRLPRGRLPTLGELCDIFLNPQTTPKISRPELLSISVTIKNILQRDLRAIVRDRELTHEKMEKVKQMEKESLIILKRVKRAKMLYKMHARMVENIERLIDLSLDMLSTTEPLKRNLEISLDNVQKCELQLKNLHANEDNVATECIETFRGALKTITFIGGRMFEYIFTPFEIAKTFMTIKFYMSKMVSHMNENGRL